MLFNTATVLVLAAAVARAIQITAPTNTSEWTAGQPQTITWDHVSTDPSTFDISIEIPNPAKLEKKTIAEKVSTSDGSYTWTPDTDIHGSQYRITFSGENGILAQSGYFDVKEGSASAASSASAAATSAGASGSAASAGASASATSAASGASTSAASVPSGSIASGTQGAIPNASSTKPNGAGALVPSLALVGGSLIALLL